MIPIINASNEFKLQLANDNRNYLEYADITLKNGTVLNLANKDLWNGGLSIDDAVSSDNSFDIGSAIINKCTLTINNIYDEFSDYVFEDAKVVGYVGLELPDGTIEKIRKGTYEVDEPSYNGSIITLSCLDNMRKFDRSYSESKLAYPATLNTIVRDACSVCGVSLQTVNFPHDDFIVQTRPTDEAITFREVISWVAQIACCFCRCDTLGRLELKWYDQEALENPKVVDWGAENTTEPENAHWLRINYSAPVVSLDDVVITGVRVVEKNESEDRQEQLTTYQSGTDGYVISIENNELIKEGAGQTVAGWLGEQLIGVKFRKSTVNHASDPTIEAGDIAVVTDRKGNNYNIVVSSTKFSTGGSQNTVSAAENPARNSAARYSAQTKNYVEWRKSIEKEKTEREKALEALGERLENSPGVFTTVETQSNGSNIYYLHNKPNLTESDMVWKMTAEAWGVSTDGGKTWNAGMTVDGDTIVRILTAVGLNADWINTGALTVKDSSGNVLFNADIDTGSVDIVADSFSLRGKTIEEIAKESTKDYVTTVVNDAIKDVNTQHFEAYEPTLNNSPASEWSTTEIKDSHLNDLFYNTSTKKIYRFVKNGSTYSWENFVDPDIQKALEDASAAQDTADGKRRVFITTPRPPYDPGDMWLTSTTNGQGAIKVCKTGRTSGSYYSSDWVEPKYTDDTVANSALSQAKDALIAAQAPEKYLSQLDVFNVLTNNGTIGLIKKIGNELYINASYINSGTISANYIIGGTLSSVEIIAETGTIGGFQITEHYIRSQSSSYNMYLASYGYNGKTVMKVQYNSTDQLVIAYDGTVTMAKANITGGKIAIDGSGFGKLSVTNTGIALSQNGVIVEGTSGSASSYAVRIRAKGSAGGIIQVYPNDGTSKYVNISGSSLSVGGTKSRVIETPNYGERLQYCYEMPSPMFGDIGEGETDDAGVCYIPIDDIFAETVTADIEYQVFLQKEGPGDLWVAEKTSTYFVVKGTENLKFAWEIKAAQRDYEYERLDETEIEDEQEPDYETDYINEMDELIREQEAMYYAEVE